MNEPVGLEMSPTQVTPLGVPRYFRRLSQQELQAAVKQRQQKLKSFGGRLIKELGPSPVLVTWVESLGVEYIPEKLTTVPKKPEKSQAEVERELQEAASARQKLEKQTEQERIQTEKIARQQIEKKKAAADRLQAARQRIEQQAQVLASRQAEKKLAVEQAEAERKRLAEQTQQAERKRLAQQAARKKAEEAERKRAEDIEKKRLSEQAAAERKRAEQASEERQRAEQAEKKRLSEQAAAERKRAEDIEKKRLAEQAQQAAAERQRAEQAEKQRLAEQAAIERQRAEEAEKKRLADQAEAERIRSQQAEIQRQQELAQAELEVRMAQEERELKRIEESLRQKEEEAIVPAPIPVIQPTTAQPAPTTQPLPTAPPTAVPIPPKITELPNLTAAHRDYIARVSLLTKEGRFFIYPYKTDTGYLRSIITAYTGPQAEGWNRDFRSMFDSDGNLKRNQEVWVEFTDSKAESILNTMLINLVILLAPTPDCPVELYRGLAPKTPIKLTDSFSPLQLQSASRDENVALKFFTRAGERKITSADQCCVFRYALPPNFPQLDVQSYSSYGTEEQEVLLPAAMEKFMTRYRIRNAEERTSSVRSEREYRYLIRELIPESLPPTDGFDNLADTLVATASDYVDPNRIVTYEGSQFTLEQIDPRLPVIMRQFIEALRNIQALRPKIAQINRDLSAYWGMLPIVGPWPDVEDRTEGRSRIRYPIPCQVPSVMQPEKVTVIPTITPPTPTPAAVPVVLPAPTPPETLPARQPTLAELRERLEAEREPLRPEEEEMTRKRLEEIQSRFALRRAEEVERLRQEALAESNFQGERLKLQQTIASGTPAPNGDLPELSLQEVQPLLESLRSTAQENAQLYQPEEIQRDDDVENAIIAPMQDEFPNKASTFSSLTETGEAFEIRFLSGSYPDYLGSSSDKLRREFLRRVINPIIDALEISPPDAIVVKAGTITVQAYYNTRTKAADLNKLQGVVSDKSKIEKLKQIVQKNFGDTAVMFDVDLRPIPYSEILDKENPHPTSAISDGQLEGLRATFEKPACDRPPLERVAIEFAAEEQQLNIERNKGFQPTAKGVPGFIEIDPLLRTIPSDEACSNILVSTDRYRTCPALFKDKDSVLYSHSDSQNVRACCTDIGNLLDQVINRLRARTKLGKINAEQYRVEFERIRELAFNGFKAQYYHITNFNRELVKRLRNFDVQLQADPKKTASGDDSSKLEQEMLVYSEMVTSYLELIETCDTNPTDALHGCVTLHELYDANLRAFQRVDDQMKIVDAAADTLIKGYQVRPLLSTDSNFQYAKKRFINMLAWGQNLVTSLTQWVSTHKIMTILIVGGLCFLVIPFVSSLITALASTAGLGSLFVGAEYQLLSLTFNLLSQFCPVIVRFVGKFIFTRILVYTIVEWLLATTGAYAILKIWDWISPALSTTREAADRVADRLREGMATEDFIDGWIRTGSATFKSGLIQLFWAGLTAALWPLTEWILSWFCTVTGDVPATISNWISKTKQQNLEFEFQQEIRWNEPTIFSRITGYVPKTTAEVQRGVLEAAGVNVRIEDQTVVQILGWLRDAAVRWRHSGVNRSTVVMLVRSFPLYALLPVLGLSMFLTLFQNDSDRKRIKDLNSILASGEIDLRKFTDQKALVYKPIQY